MGLIGSDRSPETLTFSPTSWATGQPVAATAVDDANGVGETVTVQVTDNDTPYADSDASGGGSDGDVDGQAGRDSRGTSASNVTVDALATQPGQVTWCACRMSPTRAR